jgi:Ca-activated chloride channel family protein
VEYGHPEFLRYSWLLLLYLCFAAFFLWRQAKAHGAIQASLSRRFGPDFSALRAWLKLGLWTLGAVFLLKALAGPLGPPQRNEEDSQGADVILAVDVSASMQSMDIQPNRLEALKQALSRFLNRLNGDRVGLVAFAGQPVVACPLTSDTETAQLFLDKLDNDSVPVDGTALGRALATCLDKFAPAPGRGRMVILATDGEETLDSDGAAQARRAGEAGIPVFTLGLGTPEGALVPGTRDVFGRILAKTWHGEPVRSRLNEETLKQIAALSGGRYFRGASEATLEAALQRLGELQRGRAKGPARFHQEPLYQPWLFWALCFLLGDAFLSQRRFRFPERDWFLGLTRPLQPWWVRSTRIFRPAARLACFGAAFLVLCGFSLDPGRSDYDQGNQWYRQKQYDKASGSYRESLGEKQREWAQYNLGNTLYQQGDYPSAASAFEKALQLDPKDQDAAYNLGLAQKKMQEKKQDESKDKKKGKQDQKKGQKGGSGQGQGSKDGNPEGESKSGKAGQGSSGGAQSQQAPAPSINPDEAQAMMNMLAEDQKRYDPAFQPLKKRQHQNQDPMEQMFEQMTGMRLPKAEQEGKGNVKDW